MARNRTQRPQKEQPRNVDASQSYSNLDLPQRLVVEKMTQRPRKGWQMDDELIGANNEVGCIKD